MDDLIITTDSDLYRVLNLHYNRSNQIDVCEHFLEKYFFDIQNSL
jgi:hypothetical protein